MALSQSGFGQWNEREYDEDRTMKRMIRKPVTARLGVEGLEGRELMAAGFTLVDTLNAKDTIDLDRLGVIAGIETLRSENVTELQTVIASGAASTQTLGAEYAALQVQYGQAIAIGDKASAAGIKQTEALVLTTGANVRLAMRQATAVATTVDKALQTDEKQINAIYNAAIGQLARHANPFTLVPPVVNALTVISTTAQNQATFGANVLQAINTKITG
jgi:hypothetical protein